MGISSSFNESMLIQAIAKGDTAAFQQIYLHYFDHLIRHSEQFTKNTNIAKDIVQDVFLKFWETRINFINYEKIGGWLFVSVHNASLNHLKKVHKIISQENLNSALPAEDNQAMLDIVEAQYKLIESAIENLPEQRKKVFLLCKYEGFTYEQAAEQLSISKSTVKDHMSKATLFIRNYVLNEKNKPFSFTALCFIEYFLKIVEN